MKQYDAIIVGGGPAGSTCAWKMVAAGWKVLVIDAAQFPRVKLCAGWITPPVLDYLDLDLEDYCDGRMFQPYSRFRVSRIQGEPTLVDFGRPISYGIVRSQFDEYLLRRSGANVVEGQRVTRILRQDRQWVINDRYQAPLLIGAGGHYCPVARYMGVEKRSEKVISTLELEMELAPSEIAGYAVEADCPELFYFDDIRGYGWCFRKGNFMNVGIGRTKSHRLRSYLDLFLRHLEENRRIPVGSALRTESFRGHAYKLHFVTPRPSFADGILLVGDAVGLSFNYSGEGIRPAILSSLLAWETILEVRGDFSAARLSAYRERLHGAFGTPVTGWKFRFMESLPPQWFQTIGRVIFSRDSLKRFFLEKWFLRLPGTG